MATHNPAHDYYADIISVYKKPEDYELAGRGNAYVRVDAEAKVTGRAIYTDDIDLPGMYYCKLVHSPYAHALIKSIDARRQGRADRQGFPRGA